MPKVYTSIEIAATPAVVREKFLDFEQISKYAPNSYVHKLAAPEGKIVKDLIAGDIMHVSLNKGKVNFNPTVLENTLRKFCWRGNLFGLFAGDHAFRFEPVGSDENKTLFIQEEDFFGLFGWTMGKSWLAKQLGAMENTEKNYKGFNEDLKAWVEGSAAVSET
ncbi:hypothetical protein D6C97_05435 [Aureobasidium pullulans]|nr:hypothetical protein D6C97_05435 [Aureobasidium pullulans]